MITVLLVFAVQDADAWIGKLRDDDAAVRAEASEKLAALGPDALPKLRAAHEAAKDPDHKLHLAKLIERIETAEFYKKIKIEIVAPEKAPTLDEVARSSYPFTIRLVNGNDRDLLMLRYFTIRVLDKDGQELERNNNFARMGALFYDCYLENVGFRTVKAGATVDVPAGTGAEPDPVGFHLGWIIPAAGEYTIEVAYSYDRADWMRKCKRGCAHHDDAKRPWNACPEWKRTVSAKITVAP